MGYCVEKPVEATSSKLCRSKPLLGTFVDIELVAKTTDDKLRALSNLAFAEIGRIQDLMSFHDPESELSQINKYAHRCAVPASDYMMQVLTHALKLSELTAGIYDVSIGHELMKHRGLPKRFRSSEAGNWLDISIGDNTISFQKDIKIDLGGIAKGFAVDRAFQILLEQNIPYQQIAINAGGDLRLLNWGQEIVQIRHPSPRKPGHFIPIHMQAPSLATSAPAYTDKNSLIVNPETGRLCKNCSSISIFAESCMVADSLTKALFLHPNKGALLNHFNATALRIDKNGIQSEIV